MFLVNGIRKVCLLKWFYREAPFFVIVSKKRQKPSTSSKKFLLSSNQKIFCGKTYVGAAQTEPQLCSKSNLNFKFMLKSKI